MVGRFVLPLLGSAPEVWPTTVLFFQAVLLAGYAYAHLTSRLPARHQALAQLAVLAAAVVALPIRVPDVTAPDAGNPIPWLLAVLAVTAGLPFFALAANGPMLQRWLSATRHRAARDPYFLFAASNGGSLIGLLAYPVAVEPLLGLEEQGRAWAAAYALAVALVAASAVALWVRPATGANPGGVPMACDDAPLGWARRLRWVALAAVPSSLMLGATTYLTRDVSPVPLLWVLPLALYLLTLVVAFSPWTDARRLTVLGRRTWPFVAILVTYTLVVGAQQPLGGLLVLHLAGVLVAGLLCHGRLAADRPGTRRLTEFYLWVAVGGALGGAFNAVLAPLVFPALIEYPVAIVAVCLLRPAPPKTRPELLEFFLRDERPTRWMDGILPVLLGAGVALALALARDQQGEVPAEIRALVAGLACGLAVNLARRPLRFGLALAAIFVAGTVAGTQGGDLLERDRSFFGTSRVIAADEGRVHELLSGSTLHGVEHVGPGPPEPLSYYSARSPSGQAFTGLPAAATRRVAAIGLGAGSLACHARPGSEFTFYEIDPTVIRIARDPRLFTFLRDCPVRPRVVAGDGRRSLEGAPRARAGLVVVDAFNSDAIPLHLITREAFGLYLSRTTAAGTLLFHLTNRYLDLEPVVANIATDLGLSCRIQRHRPTIAERRRGIDESTWALLARRARDLGRPARDARWRDCRPDRAARTWTDDYANPLSVVDWG
jgi:hypothetical protein